MKLLGRLKNNGDDLPENTPLASPGMPGFV